MKKAHSKILTLLLLFVVALSAVFTGCGGPSVTHDDSIVPAERKQQVHEFNLTETDEYLVKDGKSDYVLVFDPAKGKEVGVDLFTTYFKAATGITIKTSADTGLTFDENQKYISLGETTVADQAGIEFDLDLSLELGTAGFIMKTVGKSIFILGGTNGTKNGVIGFMELFFNMEVYAADEVYIDSGVVDLKFFEMDVKDIPDIEHQAASYAVGSEGMTLMKIEHLAGVHVANRGRVWHNINKGVIPYEIYGVDPNGESDPHGATITSAMKNEMAKQRAEIISQLKAYSLEDIQHLKNDTTITQEMLTDQWYEDRADEYFNHYEWYAMEKHAKENPLGDGTKFEPMNVNFTISNENESAWNDGSADWHVKSEQLLHEAMFLEMEADMLKSNKRDLAYTTEDNNGWSDDEVSKANFAKYGTHAGEYIQSANRMARMFKAKYPETRLVIFSYATTTNAPVRLNETTGKYEPIDESVILDDNVDVMVCLSGNRNFAFDDLEHNEKTHIQNITWQAIAGSLQSWVYSLVYYSHVYMPTTTIMSAGNLYRYLFENNYRFVLDEARTGVANSPDWSFLKQFILKELHWDCYQDFDTLVDKFFTNYFKAAAKPMLEAWRLEMNWMVSTVQSGAVDFTGGTGGEGGMIKELETENAFPENVLLQLLAKFDEAFEAIKTYENTNPVLYQTLYRRINLETLSIRYLRWKIYGKYYGDLKNEWARSLYLDTKDFGITKFGSYDTIEKHLGTWQ